MFQTEVSNEFSFVFIKCKNLIVILNPVQIELFVKNIGKKHSRS